MLEGPPERREMGESCIRLELARVTDEEREKLPRPSRVRSRFLNKFVFMRIVDPEFGTWPFYRWLGPEPEGVEYEYRDFYKMRHELKDGLTAEWWMRIVAWVEE